MLVKVLVVIVVLLVLSGVTLVVLSNLCWNTKVPKKMHTKMEIMSLDQALSALQ